MLLKFKDPSDALLFPRNRKHSTLLVGLTCRASTKQYILVMVDPWHAKALRSERLSCEKKPVNVFIEPLLEPDLNQAIIDGWDQKLCIRSSLNSEGSPEGGPSGFPILNMHKAFTKRIGFMLLRVTCHAYRARPGGNNMPIGKRLIGLSCCKILRQLIGDPMGLPRGNTVAHLFLPHRPIIEGGRVVEYSRFLDGCIFVRPRSLFVS